MTSRCRCCRRPLTGPHWYLLAPDGGLARVCKGCAKHVTLGEDGVRCLEPCPDAGPESRPFPPAGWRLL